MHSGWVLGLHEAVFVGKLFIMSGNELAPGEAVSSLTSQVPQDIKMS